mmetsp:Transcript_12178/g.15961  ORF Transcript_12178/g.15961 Transcript_12178/m.15961 type:complete len:562 (-) Transcript_12178:396-2081(-)
MKQTNFYNYSPFSLCKFIMISTIHCIFLSQQTFALLCNNRPIHQKFPGYSPELKSKYGDNLPHPTRIHYQTSCLYSSKQELDERKYAPFSRFNFLGNERNEQKEISKAEKGRADDLVEIYSPNEADSVLFNPQTLAIIALLFGVGVICALDRVAMSVALLPMADQFQYTETEKGAISAAFTIGYMIAMTPAGLLASFSSPSKLLTGGVTVWSIAQMLSPLAAFSSIQTLLFVRFIMGMAEATTTPTLQALVSNWIPDSSKAKVLCLLISGFQIGTVLAYQVSPSLIENLNWPAIFLVYGSVGFLWLALWVPNSDDEPPYQLPESQEDVAISKKATFFKMPEEEPKGFAEEMSAAWSEIPWRGFTKSKEVVALAVAHMAQNWGLYLLLAWLPTYFSRIYGMDLSGSSENSMYPFLAGIVMGNLGGITADSIISNGILSTTNCRKLFQTIACVGPAICMHLLAQVPEHPENAITLFTIAGGLGALSSAGHAAGAQDVAKKYTGTIYGVTSALAVLAGSIGTYFTGSLLDETGQFSTIFEITAGVYIAGALWFATQFESKRIFD